MKAKFFYLIRIQYLGYRFHGWAKQPQVKTVHHMVDRTLTFVFGHNNFKTLGSSRTDAKVSANEFALELFTEEPIQENFLQEFDLNLPADISALSVKEVDKSFNIIKSPRTKEYIYLFSFGEKAHPFCAPLITTVPTVLDLELMKKGAKLFEGFHDFTAYCKQPNEKTQTQREVLFSRIEPNEQYEANFFPKQTYLLRIKAKGFLRHQIRKIMGQLLLLGEGKTTLEEIELTLKNEHTSDVFYVAPASGLILNKIEYED